MSFRKRAEELVSRMTLDEKCSQLKYDSPAIPRLGIPAAVWWNEGLHGVARGGTAAVFPQAIAFAAAFDERLVYDIACVISTEARAKYNVAFAAGDIDKYKGITLWSPNINIFRDPRWGRGQETYGEDPFLTARTGCAFVRGIQGDGEYMRASACAKHFAVHSGPEAERHGFDAQVSPRDLSETYLPAFEALVTQAGVEGVMGAYNAVNGQPSCANTELTDKLRNEWRFEGYFVSDCWAIADFHKKFGVTSSPAESAAYALRGGCDLNCGCVYEYIRQAYDEGLISEEDIDRAAVRLFTTRFRLGMFDKTEYDNLGIADTDTDRGSALALECAEKSIVMLKNDGLLPLDISKIKSIAVIGPNADRREALEGNYHGTTSRYVTFLQGIRARVGENVRIYYASGCHLHNDRTEPLSYAGDRLAEAVACAKAADVTVLFLGLDETLEGEEGDACNSYASGDKPDLRLPESQRILLKKITAVGKPVIAAVAAGSAINCENDDINALFHLWYAGERGGEAFAKILFGDTSPSGRLPVTFYRDAALLPDFSDYSMKNRTYRFADSNENILFPFGFGLTYAQISSRIVGSEKSGGGARVTVELKNGSGFSQDYSVCLYIKLYSADAVKNSSLCAYDRVRLDAQAQVNLILNVDKKAFELVRDDGSRYIDENVRYEFSLVPL